MSFVRFTLCCTCKLWVSTHGDSQYDSFRDCGEGPCDQRNCPNCPGSDVYLYRSVYGGVECCGCLLAEDVISQTFNTADELMVHLGEHVKAGHHVPAWDFHAMAKDALARQTSESKEVTSDE